MKTDYSKSAMYGILISVVVLIIVVVLFNPVPKKSKYGYGPLDPTPVKIQEKNPKGPKSIFDLQYKLDCVPGPTASASNYTKSLTPGGFCGAGQWVASQANYTITGGIGGTLLDN
jgi:hypothetical protein